MKCKKISLFLSALMMTMPVLAKPSGDFIQLLAKTMLGEHIHYDIEARATPKDYKVTLQQKQCYANKSQAEFTQRANLAVQKALTPNEVKNLEQQIPVTIATKIHQLNYITTNPTTDFSSDETVYLKEMLTALLENKLSKAWDTTYFSEDKTLNKLLGFKSLSQKPDENAYDHFIQYHQLIEQRAKDCGFEIDLP